MRAPLVAVVLAALASLGAACSRGDAAAKHRLFAREESKAEGPAFDPEHPEIALDLDADQVAQRLGSFEWSGAADWTVVRPSGPSLHVTEQHRLRQASSGEFEVRADVDPGLGPSALGGKQIVYVNGMTYARALPAPYRERPTDHGRDARRYREDSFGLVRTVARLLGPALRFEPDGSDTVLGREVLRFKLSLGDPGARGEPPLPAGYQVEDADTALRQGFLRGAAATAAAGELSVDAQSGAPLRARLSATFAAPGNEKAPGPKVTVVVSGQVGALGGEVKPIAPPANALADERKPAGPSAALEASGLKKRGEDRQAAEPVDEGD